MLWRSVVLLAAAYVLGSMPWGLMLTRVFRGVDVRATGSGNMGAFNVYRIAGLRLGLATLLGDLLKGAIPVLIAVLWTAGLGWQGTLLACLVALAAFLGHLFPVFLGFKGGKGVSTAAGCFAILSPMALFVCLLVYILVICAWGYSSAASLAAAALLPGAVWLATPHSVLKTGCALIMAVLIFVRHRENIKRLLKGREHSPLR